MTWRHVVHWLSWSGLAVLGLIVVALLASPIWLRPLLEQQATAALGRPVTIGSISLRPTNLLTATARDVVVANPDGFPSGEDPFVRLPSVTMRVDLPASLAKRYVVIASVEMDRPQVRAIATPDGRNNFRPNASLKWHPSVATVRILDGHARISLAPLQADFEVRFATEQESGPSAPIKGPDRPTNFVATAQGIYAGQPTTARFAGAAPLGAGDPARPWPIQLEVQNGPTHIVAEGTLQNPLSPESADFQLALAGPDMASLRPLTGVPFPATPPYDLRGQLAYKPDTFRVTGASGRLGRSDLQGSMTVVVGPERRPEITADLVSNAVALSDITSLMDGQPGQQGTPGQTPDQQAKAAQNAAQAKTDPRLLPQGALHLPKLERTDIHLDYRAGRIQGASMPFDNLSLHLDVVQDMVNLHRLAFGVGSGRISADIALTSQPAEAVRARTEIQFDQVDLSHLMRASGGFHGKGALSGAAQFEGTGRSVGEILASADGAGSLWMVGGDLSSLLVDLAGLRLGSALLSSFGDAPNTRVGCFVANLALRRGLLSTRQLLLETEDAVTQGDGRLDFRNERVEVRLRTQSRHLTVGVLPAPLLISGSLKEASARPDPAAHGGVSEILAALPTVQLGTGDGSRCRQALDHKRG